MKNICSIFFLTVLVGSGVHAQQGKWIELFNGQSLKGWSVHSGFAKYRVEDKTIVGTSVPKSPNTFLCTDREFGDFILEFEVMVDPKLNSGVQFRSKIAPEELTYWLRNQDGEMRAVKVPKDRVHGYQVEIAGADVGTSGGIYDEARRAMVPEWWIDKGTEASRAFKDGQWNQYRVECRGQSIKTWVNGIQTADIQDAMTPSGIIGLQVHDVGEDTTPYEVRWRNIRLMELKD